MPRGPITVHIGMEKTGTTSIQRFLSDNSAALLAGGTLVSRLGRSPNHSLLAASVVDAAKAQDIHSWFEVRPANQSAVRAATQRLLAAELDRGLPLIVSSEHLSARAVDEAEVQALAQLLESIASDVRVCLYLRRQEELIPSTYATTVRAGGVERFSLERALQETSRYDFAALVGRWRGVFGDRLAVHVFREEWKAHPADLLRHFCASVGIPGDPVSEAQPVAINAAVPAASLEMMRMLNLLQADGRVSVHLRRAFMEACERPGLGPAFSLTDDERREVWSRFAASNAVAAAALSSDDAAYLTAPPAPAPPRAEATDAVASEVVARLLESVQEVSAHRS